MSATKLDNRIEDRVAEAKSSAKKLFCGFLTYGYPGISASERLIQAAEDSGVDILELGFPFSDPLADGPTIQMSSDAAIAKGVTVEKALNSVKKLRGKGLQIPIVFFTYMNPILNYGLKKFVRDAKSAGIDGVLVPDLPPEEEKGFQELCVKQNLSLIFLIAPTTKVSRAREIAKKSHGFVYYVSLKGVTGVRNAMPKEIATHLKAVRKNSNKTFLIGFGVSGPEQAKRLSKLADGVIVGSAIIEKIRTSKGDVKKVSQYLKSLVNAMHLR